MRLINAKMLFIIAITLLLSFVGLAVSLINPNFIKPIQNIVFDGLQQLKPRQDAESLVVFAAIDEPSILTLGQWPWPRSKLAEMVEKITDAGALAIGFDIVFSENDRTSPKSIFDNLPKSTKNLSAVSKVLESLPDNDKVFAEIIRKSHVVLSFFKQQAGIGTKLEKKAGISWLGEDLSSQLENFEGSVASLPAFQSAASGLGYITLSGEKQDDIIRSVPLFASQKDTVYPSFAIEVIRIALQNITGDLKSFIIKTTYSGTEGGSADGASGENASITAAKVGDVVFPLKRDGQLTIYYARENPDRYVSAKDILTENNEWLSDKFAGKIVLFGASAVGLHDIRTTTLREAVPGVSVHGQIIDQIISGDLLQRPDWLTGAETVLAILFTLIIVILVPITGAIGAAFIGAICALIICAICWFAFTNYNYLMDPTLPLVISIAAYLLMTAMMYFFAEKEKRFVRSAFQHYLAPNLLARLERDPNALQLGGEIRHMTLMFMDVRNFTQISETLNPEQLVSFLNTLLSPLSDVIQEHEGAIDKYIGDSIMAFWNAPLDVDDHPSKACRAALKMLIKLDEMNDANAFGFEELGLGKVSIGIGINTGEGCVGNMGSSSRFDYSVIGDTVNVSARLESASKEAKWPLLVSKATASEAPEFAYLDAGLLELKGKSEPQQVFALVGDETIAESSSFSSLVNARNQIRGKSKKKNSIGLDKLHVDFTPTTIERLTEFLSK